MRHPSPQNAKPGQSPFFSCALGHKVSKKWAKKPPRFLTFLLKMAPLPEIKICPWRVDSSFSVSWITLHEGKRIPDRIFLPPFFISDFFHEIRRALGQMGLIPPLLFLGLFTFNPKGIRSPPGQEPSRIAPFFYGPCPIFPGHLVVSGPSKAPLGWVPPFPFSGTCQLPPRERRWAFEHAQSIFFHTGRHVHRLMLHPPLAN